MRKFEVNGKTLEFKDDTIATSWSPDSCDCVVIYDKDSKVLAVPNKCKVHKSTKDSKMLSEIKKHRDVNGLNDHSDDTKIQTEKRMIDRAKEKQRIQKLEFEQ